MPRSQSLIEAQQRYYLKTRATRVVKMREKARKDADKVKEKCANSPEEAEKVRKANQEKYYKSVVNANKRRIQEWLDDKNISPVFKEFLRKNVNPVINNIPKQFLDMCWKHLSIICGLNGEIIFPTVVNGETQGQEGEGEVKAEAQEGEGEASVQDN